MNSKYTNIINYTNQTLFHDFFSNPNNPEELFSLLYPLYKSDKCEIYKAIYNETREIFCIKKFSTENIITDKKASKNFYNKIKEETSLMKSLKHNDNILMYYGSFFSFETKNIWLVYEYMQGGSVYDLGKILDRDFTEEEIALIINDILHGLIFIHQLNIINRNIKISNILLTQDGKAKIGNFEKAIQKLNIKKENELVNSLSFKDKNYEDYNDPKYDIFLIGLICIELFTGIKHKFDKESFTDQIKINKLSSSNINLLLEKELNKNGLKTITVEFKDFIINCLNSSPYKRPTAFELVNHFFIKKNINETNKISFTNLVKNNIEKIENNKEMFYKNNLKLNRKMKQSFYATRKSNTGKTSLNISNINNKSFDTKSNFDKLAEFRIEQMKKNEIIPDDKNISKDLYSNLDNSSILHNDKKENIIYDNDKENNLDNIIIKECDDLDIDIDFKSKWEHIQNFQNKLNIEPQFSENNINYNYSSHILKFSIKEEEEKINNSLKESIPNIDLNIKNGIPFTESKCDIIKLNPNINHKSSKKLNDSSYFSLKNSVYTKNIENKQLHNTITFNNEIDNKISTRNESVNSKNNIVGIILDKRNSCAPFKHKKIKLGENCELIKHKFEGDYLYKYLDDLFEDKNKSKEIKKQKTGLIKINKLSNSQKNIKRIKLD